MEEFDDYSSAMVRCPLDDIEWQVDGWFYNDPRDQQRLIEKGVYLVYVEKNIAFRPDDVNDLLCEFCWNTGEVESHP